MISRSKQQVACLISCMVSSVSSVALTTLVTLFATSTLERAPIQNQALAAAVLDLVALSALLPYTLVRFWKVNRVLLWTSLRRWSVALIVILPSLVASCLSIYVLAWMYNNPGYLGYIRAARNTTSLINVALAMWAISLVAQAIFFTLCLRQSSLPNNIISSSETGIFSVESAYKQPQQISMSVFAAPSYPRSLPESPTLSNYTASPIASVRNSMTQFLRPTSSKTRLIAVRKDSFSAVKDTTTTVTEIKPDPVRQEDGFETWEVVTVNPSTPTASQYQRLETIPGSRPVSPANPLDGPFISDLPPPESIALPESPPNAYLQGPISSALPSPHYPTSPISSASSPTAHTFIPPFAASSSHRPSAASDQYHIHPLFRTDSPTPPPTASPGTILTASPWGGQTLPADAEFGRSRKNSAWARNGEGSRPASPAPSLKLANRPGSSKGATTVANSGLRSPSFGDLRDAQKSVAGGGGSGMVGRAPTPPMPELMRVFLRGESSTSLSAANFAAPASSSS